MALLIDSSHSFGRALLRGINRYQHEHGPWSCYFRAQGLHEPRPAWLDRWEGDGVILQVQDQEMAEAVLQRGLPAVDVTFNVVSEGIPRVAIDHSHAIQLAMQHLWERRYRRIGYIGPPAGTYPRLDERSQLFVDHCSQLGVPCDLYRARRQGTLADWHDEQQRIAQWVTELPKPVGIVGALIESAHDVMSACHLADVAVPDEVAVVSLGHDELICSLNRPALTYVDPGSHRVGYAAAELLDRQMHGERVKAETHLIEPLGLIAQGSSDAFAIEDSPLQNCMQFLRENACRGIKVEDVVARARGMSRRVLDARFQQIIGRTIHEEIQRIQIEHAKQLLQSTDLRLAEIATRCGFAHTEYLSVLFKKKTGITPGQYRPSAG